MKNNLELKTIIRFCYWCKQSKTDDQFANAAKHYHSGRPVGRCRACVAIQNREYRLTHKEEMKAYQHNRRSLPSVLEADRKRSYKRRFGITKEEYEARLAEQSQCCFLCGVHEKVNLSRWGVLCLDHDHVTGQLRRFLCARCNKGLGCFSDDPVLLDKAAQYIRSFKGEKNAY